MKALLDDAEAIYRSGELILADLEARYVSFEKWADAIIDAPVFWENGKFAALNAPIGRNDELVRADGSRIAAEILLQELAPDQSVRDIIQNPKFWNEATIREPGSGLAWALSSIWRLHPSSDLRKASAPAMTLAVVHLFTDKVFAPRTAYFEQLNTFRLKIMKTLELQTSRQKRAFKKICETLESAEYTVRNFPTWPARTCPLPQRCSRQRMQL